MDLTDGFGCFALGVAGMMFVAFFRYLEMLIFRLSVRVKVRSIIKLSSRGKNEWQVGKSILQSECSKSCTHAPWCLEKAETI